MKFYRIFGSSHVLIFKIPFYLSPFIICLLLYACTSSPSGSETAETITAESTAAASQEEVVEVIARGLRFEAPDEIPSGWNTIRLDNQSNMIHFALLSKMPEGRGVEEHQQILVPTIQNIMDDINGKTPSAPEAGFEPPEWMNEIVFLGGPGLLSAGQTTDVIVNLDPGTYVLECYVKSNGIFHSFSPDPDAYGMVHEFIVTKAKSTVKTPEADIEINLSSENGIDVKGKLSAGSQLIKINYLDQQLYENFVGHDIHLLKIDADTDLEEVNRWMNWARPDGLETPAPAEFVGGINEMPAGETAYLKIDLEPGVYAWIAEVPDPASKNMLKTFTVGGESL